jgi:hypothetical protein
MNSKQVTKYLSLHGEGLLSSNEVAVGILYELLSEPELDLASLSSVGSLPVGVQEELLNLLRRIQVADYQWRPLLFSSGPYPDFPDFPGKLRKICDLLGV